MVDTSRYAFVKIHTESELECKLVHHNVSVLLISCNKCTTLM